MMPAHPPQAYPTTGSSAIMAHPEPPVYTPRWDDLLDPLLVVDVIPAAPATAAGTSRHHAAAPRPIEDDTYLEQRRRPTTRTA